MAYEKPFTEKDLDYIKANYNQITHPKLYRGLPDWRGCEKVFYRKCLKLGFRRDKKNYPIPKTGFYNQEYWKDLNLINCYLAGNIAADGNLNLTNGIHKLRLCVEQTDESLIDCYVRELQFSGNKGYNQRTHKTGNKTIHVVASFTGFNKNAEYLKKYFNLVPNKTYRLGPTNLSNENFNFAYLIGYCDGDGTISMTTGSNRTQRAPYLYFISCSESLLVWIEELLNRKFPPEINRNQAPRVHRKSKTNSWVYSISGLRATVIINYLRKFPVPKLARKWENPEVLAFIEDKKKLYPELFIEPDQSELLALMPTITQAATFDALLAQNQFNMPNLALNQDYIPQLNILPPL